MSELSCLAWPSKPRRSSQVNWPLADPSGVRSLLGDLRTPAYGYDRDVLLRRLDVLRAAFGGRFAISYAVKANPNAVLLAAMAANVDGFDVSSIGEAERVLRAAPGVPMTFTGPGKREDELRRFATTCAGHIVLESVGEAEDLSRIVVESELAPQAVLLRINPLLAPRGFGASMAGRASPFGIDEENVDAALAAIAALPGLKLAGFHCFPAASGLKAEMVAANLVMMADLFRRCVVLGGLRPSILIFGAGFGIPCHAGDADLDLDAVAAEVNPALDGLRAEPALAETRFVLELGRWIVGPAGYLLTTVVRIKDGRDGAIRICDAGFNTNMAACGMLGGAFRRNWRISNLTNPEGEPETCDIVGPLCTSLDRIAADVTLPAVRQGDVLAVAYAGAYGPTASPNRFISHPEPAEVLIVDGRIVDITEPQPSRVSA